MRSKIWYPLVVSGLLLTFCSCDISEKKEREYTYFGGEIVNPNSNYVIISKGDHLIDTIYLNNQNRFLYKIKDPEEGLYNFRHKPEFQIVLLEKGDSIMMRLNTIEFDETLVFTGEGAVKNNFLIDMFLQNEKERAYLRNIDFKLPPALFKIKQDSLLKNRRRHFDKFRKRNRLSGTAEDIARASYEYDFYSRFELYASQKKRSKGLGNESFQYGLSDSFFDYRKRIDLNNPNLKLLSSYIRFLNYYLDNQALAAYYEKYEVIDQLRFAMQEMNVIDSLFNNEYIKNKLLRRVAGNFFLKSKNAIDSKRLLDHFLSINSNKEFKKEMTKLAKATIRLIPYNTIPDQNLIASNGEYIKLSSLFQKPYTALYFWSTENKDHYVRAHRKASALGKTYPHVDFIGINIDDNQTKNWLKTIKRNRFDLQREYEFKNPKCSSEELVIHYSNKVILVDQEGKIVDPNTNLFSVGFEKQLINSSSDPLASE